MDGHFTWAMCQVATLFGLRHIFTNFKLDGSSCDPDFLLRGNQPDANQGPAAEKEGNIGES